MRKISLLFVLGLMLIGLSSCDKKEDDPRRQLLNKGFDITIQNVDYKLSFRKDRNLFIEHQISGVNDPFLQSLGEKTQKAIVERIEGGNAFTIKFNCLYNHNAVSYKVFIHKDESSVEQCAKDLAGIDDGFGDAITAIVSIGIANIVAHKNKTDYAEELYKKLKEVTDFLGEKCSFDYETQELELASGQKYLLRKL